MEVSRVNSNGIVNSSVASTQNLWRMDRNCHTLKAQAVFDITSLVTKVLFNYLTRMTNEPEPFQRDEVTPQKSTSNTAKSSTQSTSARNKTIARSSSDGDAPPRLPLPSSSDIEIIETNIASSRRKTQGGGSPVQEYFHLHIFTHKLERQSDTRVLHHSLMVLQSPLRLLPQEERRGIHHLHAETVAHP